MFLRVVIAAQIVWVALAGLPDRVELSPFACALIRGMTTFVPPMPLIAFPALVAVAMWRSPLPRWKCVIVWCIEVVLLLESIIAVLPGIQ
jgi:hypothetical protein